MYQRNHVSNIREEFKRLLEDEIYVTDKTGVKMLEITSASFIADEPTIFGKLNLDYIERELAWYESQSLNVNNIPGGPPAIWKQVADSSGYINSNYGWCVWSEDNHDQYNHVRNELMNNPESRRAIMIYTRPAMWNEYNYRGRSDFMCTNAVQYIIRDGQLNSIVQMRSNDVVFGYRNDFAWQKHVLDKLATDIGVNSGTIHWNAGSLHVYSRHFDMVK